MWGYSASAFKTVKPPALTPIITVLIGSANFHHNQTNHKKHQKTLSIKIEIGKEE
jgi:hypothetical protein